MSYYGLSPAHYFTLPSYSFDACLEYTNVKLELWTDPEMHLSMENSICGGIFIVSHRYARADNQYLKSVDYDSSQPYSYVMHLNANNLYGWEMSQKLSVRDFRFLSDEEISNIDF
jgi:hypothetical protein